MREAGLRYILGFQKRGRVVSDELLEKHQDLGSYSRTGEGGSLLNKEVVYYILCYNPAKAEDNRKLTSNGIVVS